MRKEKERHAVVLSGGGGHGAFEVGVLRALIDGESPSTGKQPLDAEIFSGTSVGAFNAAALASSADVDLKTAVADLEDLWLNRIAGDLGSNGVLRVRGNLLSLLDLQKLIRDRWKYVVEATSDAAFLSVDAGKRLAGFLRSDSSLVDRTMEMLDFASFISTQPLEDLVFDTISLAKLQRSPRVLKIATTDWSSGNLRIFVHDPFPKPRNGRGSKEEPLTEEVWPSALLASAAIPGVFPPVLIDGSPYVDGGVVMNTPLRPAVDAGATTVHLICLNPDATDMPMNTGLHIFERLMHLAVTATLNDDVEKIRHINSLIVESAELSATKGYQAITVHRYNPRMDLGGFAGMLDFRPDRIRRRIEIGQLAGRNHNCELDRCVLPGKSDWPKASPQRKPRQSNPA